MDLNSFVAAVYFDRSFMNDISTIPYGMRSNVKLSIHNLHAHLPRYSFTVILEQFLLLSLFFVVQTPGKIEMNRIVSYQKT